MPETSLRSQIDQRAALLVERFRFVAATRMAGVPLLNAALAVEALGFEACGEQAGQHSTDGEAGQPGYAAGVLITPWFMNLVWFPVRRSADRAGVGIAQARSFGQFGFDAIGGYDEVFGAYEACSLFSPMSGFADQAQARAVARAVIEQAGGGATPRPVPQSGRRAFLTGRRGAAA